ncbi:MAG TPA: hypothetical protein VKB75_10315 [Jatrophihabitans sp.]|nr:hypothetical protein [Jatrophihabitans sp.]
MVRAVAFCPHPPLLVPEVAQGAASELDDLRGACFTAIKRAASVAGSWVVVGAGARSASYPPNAHGSLAGFGVDLELSLGSDEPGPVELPLSLTIGAWLLRETLGADSGASGYSIGPDGGALPLLDDDDQAFLVMGDGSARRSTSAPGYLDPRAGAFDAAVAGALGSGVAARLRTDAQLGGELWATGPVVWNAVADALGDAVFSSSELLYDAAPYGVGYFAAVWTGRD